MVHDDGCTIAEGFPDRIASGDVLAHFLRAVFVACEAAVERVENDCARRHVAGLHDRGDEPLMVLHQRKLHRDEKEGNLLLIISKVTLHERLFARGKVGLPFEKTINDGTLLNTAAAIVSTKSNMHNKIKNPKCLSAFWRPIHDNKAERN